MKELIEFIKRNKKEIIEIYNRYKNILDDDPSISNVFKLLKNETENT